MGDQIYADDVSAALLMQLMDASNTLLGMAPSPAAGWHGEETLPCRSACRRTELSYAQAERLSAAVANRASRP